MFMDQLFGLSEVLFGIFALSILAQGRHTRNIHEDSIFYHHEISQLSSRESRKSRRRRVASPALVGFAECFQPDGTRKR